MTDVLYSDLKKAGHYLVSEDSSLYLSRDAVTLEGTGLVKSGTVLGKTTAGSATAAAKEGGNTGNGTIAMDGTTPVLGGANSGVYIVRCTAAATNGGTFSVTDPDGNDIGDATVGSAFANEIKFTISDGATDFAVGDGFDVTVVGATGIYKPLSVGASDGTQTAIGILWEDRDPTDGPVKAVVTARDAQVRLDALVWPAGITEAQKATALGQLASLHIIGR